MTIESLLKSFVFGFVWCPCVYKRGERPNFACVCIGKSAGRASHDAECGRGDGEIRQRQNIKATTRDSDGTSIVIPFQTLPCQEKRIVQVGAGNHGKEYDKDR